MSQTQAKPFAGFDDFDACVTEHEGEVEDPEAFCGWLQEQAKDALSDPNAKNVLTSLTSEFVSSVDRPAQDSEWLIFKNADADRKKARRIERPYVFADSEDVAAKAADVDVRATNDDGEKQIAYGAVLIPNEADKQGDVIPPYVVERSAHEYMAEYRKMDSDHDLDDGAGVPVESWVLKEPKEFTTPDGDTVSYPAGTWVLGKRFVDDEWKRVKSGELNGFSIYGAGTPIDVDTLVDKVERATKGVADTKRTRMKHTLNDVQSSPNPGEDLARRIQQSKANMPDDEAKDLANTLMSAAERIEQAYDEDKGEHGDDEDDEDDEEDAVDEVDDGEMKGDCTGCGKQEEDPCEDGWVMVGMKPNPNGSGEVPNCVPEEDADEANLNGSVEDMKDDNNTDDGVESNVLPDDTPEWAKSIHEMSKSTKDAVSGIRDDVDSIEARVNALEKEVDPDAAPENDRLDGDGDPDNDRMKSVEKKVDAIVEATGVDPDAADDPDVVRKGIREQAERDPDAAGTKETYEGIVDGDAGRDSASGSAGSGVEGNPRLRGGGN